MCPSEVIRKCARDITAFTALGRSGSISDELNCSENFARHIYHGSQYATDYKKPEDIVFNLEKPVTSLSISRQTAAKG